MRALTAPTPPLAPCSDAHTPAAPTPRHYYLLDLCYYGNTLLLIHLWLLPRSYLLARTTFALNSGPLAFTILAFRNSLVYHDMVGGRARELRAPGAWCRCRWCAPTIMGVAAWAHPFQLRGQRASMVRNWVGSFGKMYSSSGFANANCSRTNSRFQPNDPTQARNVRGPGCACRRLTRPCPSSPFPTLLL